MLPILRSGLSFYIGCIINGIISYLRYLCERVSSLFIISISVGNLVSNFLLGQKLEKGLSLNILVVLLLAVSRLVKIAISSIM